MFFFGLQIESCGVIISSKDASSRSSITPLSFEGVDSAAVEEISGLLSIQNDPASYKWNVSMSNIWDFVDLKRISGRWMIQQQSSVCVESRLL